jgi:hypothetical protein
MVEVLVRFCLRPPATAAWPPAEASAADERAFIELVLVRARGGILCSHRAVGATRLANLARLFGLPIWSRHVEALEELLETPNEAGMVPMEEMIRWDGGECMRAIVEGFGRGAGEERREILSEMMKKKRANGLTLLQQCVVKGAVECVRGLLGVEEEDGGGGEGGEDENGGKEEEGRDESRRRGRHRQRGEGWKGAADVEEAVEEEEDVGVNEKTRKRTGPFEM